jgi:hypothetical protein
MVMVLREDGSVWEIVRVERVGVSAIDSFYTFWLNAIPAGFRGYGGNGGLRGYAGNEQ